MIKTAIATLAATAAVVAPSAAFAGPYVNVEANSSFTGSDYTGTTTDAHVGYAGDIGSVGYYAQVGPSFVTTDGGESDTVLSGKVGALSLLLNLSPSMVSSHSLVVSMMLTTVMVLRQVLPGPSDNIVL